MLEWDLRAKKLTGARRGWDWLGQSVTSYDQLFG